MYVFFQIVVCLSYLYTVRSILYNREKSLTKMDIFFLLCAMYWIVLMFNHLFRSQKHIKQQPEFSTIYKDPDEWDGTYIYPIEQNN